MKRLLVIVLAAVLVVATLVGCGDGNEAFSTLIVGSSLMSGDFINGFGNKANDAWVKSILHNYYSTYVVTDVGEIVLNNTVVKNLDDSLDDAGNKTYTFEIHDDLKWSNGEAITAKDYVFTVLWYASKEWVDAGASSDIGSGLLGYTGYFQDANRFAGVKLIDDYKFSVTIAANELPSFYETTYAAIYPVYMAGWSPCAKIDSTADGAKLTSDSPDWTLAFDTKRVAQTERFAPTVTSGPFSFVSYENTAVTLKVNPMFKGDYKGQKPQLDYIIIRCINQYLDVDDCINGKVDAVTGVVEGIKIETAKTADTVETAYYARNGYGGVFFHCDFGPVQYKEVRHAIAYLMDRQEIIDQMLGGNGSVVNSYYGLAQWMYLENKADIDALPKFVLDLDKANELLDETPYKFEADGKTPFNAIMANAEGGYYRYNDKGERLTIKHLETEDGGALISPLAMQLEDNTPLAGIEWQVFHSDFTSLLDHYYDGHLKSDGERKYHSFSLATNFTHVFDPYYNFHNDYLDVPWHNNTRTSNPELDEIMITLRSLDPGQRDEFSTEWVKFQIKWNELLPEVPLYSNHYHDVYRKEVIGFRNTPFVTWADIVCEITKTE